MKKLFFSAAIVSALMLGACGDEEDTASKEETPITEKVEEKDPIEQAVKDVVKKDFEIEESEGIVNIQINDKNIHEGSKSLLLKKSGKIFAKLSKIKSVKSPTILWYAPLTDQYGNEKMGEVLGIFFDAETFKKVNWDNYDKLDLEAISYGYKQHETLKD